MQSHIRLTSSLCISSYIRKPFLINDFAPDPIWIFEFPYIYEENFVLFFISVLYLTCHSFYLGGWAVERHEVMRRNSAGKRRRWNRLPGTAAVQRCGWRRRRLVAVKRRRRKRRIADAHRRMIDGMVVVMMHAAVVVIEAKHGGVLRRHGGKGHHTFRRPTKWQKAMLKGV